MEILWQWELIMGIENMIIKLSKYEAQKKI